MEQKPQNLAYEDFAKLDLRAGTILSIEPVPKSKKLLKLEVSFGTENRTILAGIASAYPDRVMVGQRVIAVLNLAPREMMGIMSNGMLLASFDTEGKLWLASPGPHSVPDGAELG